MEDKLSEYVDHSIARKQAQIALFRTEPDEPSATPPETPPRVTGQSPTKAADSSVRNQSPVNAEERTPPQSESPTVVTPSLTEASENCVNSPSRTASAVELGRVQTPTEESLTQSASKPAEVEMAPSSSFVTGAPSSPAKSKKSTVVPSSPVKSAVAPSSPAKSERSTSVLTQKIVSPSKNHVGDDEEELELEGYCAAKLPDEDRLVVY
jgi:hypothetical protein